MLENAFQVQCDSTSHPAAEGVSAEKNTYTYGAHTYQTKVRRRGLQKLSNSTSQITS